METCYVLTKRCVDVAVQLVFRIISMSVVRYAYAALVAVLVAAAMADSMDHSDEEHVALRCETCRVLCVEYEKGIENRPVDEKYTEALAAARQKTTDYLWDRKHLTLRPPAQHYGDEVIDLLSVEIDKNIMTRYNEEVIMHAMHSAAHLNHPPKLSSHFCHRVLCVERMHVCKAVGDDEERPHGKMNQQYQHLVHSFDRHHIDPELHVSHNRHPGDPEDHMHERNHDHDHDWDHELMPEDAHMLHDEVGDPDMYGPSDDEM
jgi:hypothetical protein